MNKKFYDLSNEKQNKIKHAGYKIFGENSFKKASMKNLADEAGISKALVFHYFKNKMTLYHWLFNEAVAELNVLACIDLSTARDFFNLINEVVTNRLEMMEEYQHIYQFVNRVFIDSMEEGHEDAHENIRLLTEDRKQHVISHIDSDKFLDPTQIPLLYDLLNDLGSGFYYNNKHLGIGKQKDIMQFLDYIDSIRSHYYKEEYL